MPTKRLTTTTTSLIATALTIATLTACGNTTPGDTVIAKVGNNNITRAMVNHWMTTLAHEDFYGTATGQMIIPPTLATDPPNYPLCIKRLETAAAQSPTRTPPPPGPRLLAKCHELYQALKQQATSLLVTAAWYTEVARELGITATNNDIHTLVQRSDAELKPFDERRHLLDTHQISHNDELHEAKLALISQRVQVKLRGGGNQTATKLAELEAHWTAKTHCQPGYIVQHCSQYTNQEAHPPPSILMEQIAALMTGRCVNLPACSKQ